MALPHYLTSGASSRAHYALLRRLDAAPTLHDADEAIREEVARCRAVLEGNVSLATASSSGKVSLSGGQLENAIHIQGLEVVIRDSGSS